MHGLAMYLEVVFPMMAAKVIFGECCMALVSLLLSIEPVVVLLCMCMYGNYLVCRGIMKEEQRKIKKFYRIKIGLVRQPGAGRRRRRNTNRCFELKTQSGQQNTKADTNRANEK